jgi:hypothetical protein
VLAVPAEDALQPAAQTVTSAIAQLTPKL